VRIRAARAVASGERIFVSSIVVSELWYGIHRSSRQSANTRLLEAFLETILSIPFDDDDAAVAGAMRADLRLQGNEIGSYDCLIAAQAMRRDLLLITADRGFSRVKGLRWESWET
jgi:tRNA(fMet)-specific endonuclease VapC